MNRELYVTDDMLEVSKRVIEENFQERKDYYLNLLEEAKNGDCASMYYIGGALTRNNPDSLGIKAGVGWLIKAAESDNDCEEKKRAKYFLADIFLPSTPYIIDNVKMKTQGIIDDDAEYGMKMLNDCLSDKYEEFDLYLKLSTMYLAGAAVERDLIKAKEYYEKAISLDKDKEIDENFRDYYTSLL